MFNFSGGFNSPIFDLPGNATNLLSFFRICGFNQPVSGWDTSGVVSMNGTFSQNNNFNQSLSNWDFTSVTDMNNFLLGAPLSSANYNGLLAKLRADAEGPGITFGMTLGAQGKTATGQGVTDRTWLINNTAMTIIDATP